ncbi:hypothetical protein [Okeania sp. SIO1I7]|uniref:hypothetical protein n=1 Tax=Okeania sp. SIO1I7 TaxID=2607772 RepID=UPI0013F6A336|nr:hypothetical protein [Okeania sp. SIO1I7]NET28459.1 hypothetical protein [Okeania sp. SIO1I7]
MTVLESVGDGEMGRRGDGEMGRWGDGEMGSVGEIKKYISSPLPCRTTKIFTLSKVYLLHLITAGSAVKDSIF